MLRLFRGLAGKAHGPRDGGGLLDGERREAAGPDVQQTRTAHRRRWEQEVSAIPGPPICSEKGPSGYRRRLYSVSQQLLPRKTSARIKNRMQEDVFYRRRLGFSIFNAIAEHFLTQP